MLNARFANGDLRSGDCRKADQRADLDMVRADPVGRTLQRQAAVNDHGVGADALDARAHGDQEMREILYMRLGGAVAQDGEALCRNGGAQRIFGTGDRGLVEENVGALQSRGLEVVGAIHLDVGAELLQRQKMCIHAAATDHVSTRRRQCNLAATCEKRPGEKDGGTDSSAKSGIEIGRTHFLRFDFQLVAAEPTGFRAHGLNEFDECLDIANARHIGQMHDLIGQQCRGNNRQRRILIAAGLDLARKTMPSLDNILNFFMWQRFGHDECPSFEASYDMPIRSDC